MKPSWKLDWSNEKSVRVWLRTMSRAIRGTADMIKGIADAMESAMPPLPDGAEPEEALDMPQICVHCGKTDEEVRLVVPGPAGGICEACTRSACTTLGIALADVVR